MLRLQDLARRPDFRIGDLSISPARRRVDGPSGSRLVEPQFMLVFLRLLGSAGTVVTRNDLFEDCWGGAPVGDDSLNRAVAGARQITSATGSSAFEIETVPRTGYILRLTSSTNVSAAPEKLPAAECNLQLAVEDALDCWRTGSPFPDQDAIDALKSALAASPADGRAWGVYALLLRKAAEYGAAEECALFVRKCEQAARRALTLVPGQKEALVALAGVVPIFGNWLSAREQLAELHRSDPNHVPAAHDMAVLEMATGRPSAAKPLIEQLIARDPLGATFYYKRMYHLWTFGELLELDRVALRALQLWPRHAAIWSARFWSLLFTDRALEACRFLVDEECRPPMPLIIAELLQRTSVIAAARQSGRTVDALLARQTIELALAAAARGPSQAVAALFSLCATNAIDEAFEVAYGYYLGEGSAVPPVRHGLEDPSITDQHRRVTQPLFIPSARTLREDSRFTDLCGKVGLTQYWERSGITPDFLL